MAAPPRRHGLADDLRDAQGREHIGLEHSAGIGRRELEDRSVVEDAGIVNQDVEVCSSLAQFADEAILGDIAG